MVHSPGPETLPSDPVKVQLSASKATMAAVSADLNNFDRTGRKVDFTQTNSTITVSTLSKNLLDPGGSTSDHLLISTSQLSGELNSRDVPAKSGDYQRGSVAEGEREPLFLSRKVTAANAKQQQEPRPVLQSALRSRTGLPPRAGESKSKKLRVTWKAQPEYYSSHRHHSRGTDASSAIEVSHNAPARRSASEPLSQTPVQAPVAVEKEEIPLGDHWGSMQDASMSMKRVLTDPDFSSKWGTDKDKPGGFITMLHTLFNQVQEAAWPSNAQPASRRVLITVTLMGTIGALRLVVAVDAQVEDIIKSALELYAKEARLPVLGTDTSKFQLYLSPYTTKPLPKDDKICDTGSRSFVLWGPGLSRPDQWRRVPTSCAQEHQMGPAAMPSAASEPSSYISLQLYDSGAESPTESGFARYRSEQGVLASLPWWPSTLKRCIPV